jgi:hypothetical protein
VAGDDVGAVVEGWRLLAKLGAGAAGVVYEARRGGERAS